MWNSLNVDNQHLNISVPQTVLDEVAKAGWKKADDGRDTGDIKEEELRQIFNIITTIIIIITIIRHIFNMIDKDKSGFLSQSVRKLEPEKYNCSIQESRI